MTTNVTGNNHSQFYSYPSDTKKLNTDKRNKENVPPEDLFTPNQEQCDDFCYSVSDSDTAKNGEESEGDNPVSDSKDTNAPDTDTAKKGEESKAALTSYINPLMGDFQLPPELTLKVLEEAASHHTNKVCKLWHDIGENLYFELNPKLIAGALTEGRYYDALRVSSAKKLLFTPEISEIIKQINLTLPSANKVQQLLLLKATENLFKKIPSNFEFADEDDLGNLLAYAAIHGKYNLMNTMSSFSIPFYIDDPLDIITQAYNNGHIRAGSMLMQTFPELVIQEYPNLTRPRAPINPIITANAFSKTTQNISSNAKSNLITRLGRDHTQSGRDFYRFLKQVASKDEKAYLSLVEVAQTFTIAELSDAIFSTKCFDRIKKALLSRRLDERAHLLDVASEHISTATLELILTTLHSTNPEDVIQPVEAYQSKVLFTLHKHKLQGSIPGAFTQGLHADLLPIMNACVTGDYETVNQLLNGLEDPLEEFGDEYCEMIVKITCYHGHVQILQLLKDKAILEDYKEQALFSACEGGHNTIVAKLLEDPNLYPNEAVEEDDEDPHRPTSSVALSSCISHGHTSCMDLLLKDSRTEIQLADIFDPCYQKGRLDTLKRLIKKKKLTISECVNYLSGAFKKLTTAESLPVAKYLLTHPAFKSSDFSKNFQDNCLFCCQEGRLDLLKLLLEKNSTYDNSLITESILFDQPEILDYLLTTFPNPEICLVEDFKLAASLGCLAQVQRLVKDSRIADHLKTKLPISHALYEETLTIREEAILLAAENGHKEVAEFLQTYLQIDCHAHPILKCFDSVMEMKQTLIVKSEEMEISDVTARKRRWTEKEEGVGEESTSTVEEEARKQRRLEKLPEEI